MEDNLIGTLSMFRTMDIKPNFSDLARSYGKDRHTIRKMYDGEGRKERKRRASELDAHADDIVGLLSHPGTGIKGAYWYLRNERGSSAHTTTSSISSGKTSCPRRPGAGRRTRFTKPIRESSCRWTGSRG